MFVKVTVPISSVGTNWALSNAIRATCKAAAGTTPATPAGCTNYEVLSNVEAGGWVDNSAASNYLSNNTDTSGDLVMMAATKKNNIGIDEMAKHFKITFGNSSPDDQITRIDVGVTYPTGTYSANSTPQMQQVFTNMDAVDFDDSEYHSNWYISSTQNYFWFWNESYSTLETYLFGIADLSGTPPGMLSENNYYVPVASLTSFVSGTHNHTYSFHCLNYGIHDYNNNNTSKYDNFWSAVEQNGTTSLSMDTTSPPFSIYNYTSTSSPSSVLYQKSMNTDGKLVDSLHPVARYSPMANIPFETLDGIKNVGRFKGLVDAATGTNGFRAYVNKFVYDENGERYMVVHYNPWSPVAIRCV